MQITTLGELSVDGRAVRGQRLVTVLRELVDARGRPVSVAALVDAVWPDATPADATGAVQALVSRLRRAGLPVTGVPGGYRLPLDGIEVDVLHARALVADATAALAAGRPADAHATAARARALLPESPDLTDAATARLLSDVACTAARAALDGGGTLDGADLRRLATRTPPDEPAVALLVRLLAAQGRDAEALELVEQVRAELADRYGTDPSRVVTDAHLALLRGELASTDAPGGTPGAPVPDARRVPAAGAALPQHDDHPARPGDDSPAGPRLSRTDAHPRDGAHAHTGAHPHDTSVPRPGPPLPAGWRRSATALLGRAGDVAAVRASLQVAPVVTVVAPGGSGKTRLAAEVARAEAAHRPVRVVELAGLRSPDEVLPAVLLAVGGADLAPTGVEVTTQRRALDPVERLRLAGQDLEGLVVLDNCEHVLDAAAAVAADLLSAAPAEVAVLATSRAPLGLVGEVVHRLDQLADDDAVRLLRERAEAARPGLAWDDARARELCRRLDHLPLAIELAAARLRSMPVADVLAGLDDRFGLLDDALRGLPEHHASLWTMVDWSHALLTPAQQRLLQRVAVLPGPFGADVAASVAGTDEADVRHGLAALVEQSLLTLDEQGDVPRYRMLETVREYGETRLAASGGRDDALRGLVAWGSTLGRVVLPDLVGPGQAEALRTVARDQDLLVEALRQALHDGDEPAACDVLAVLAWSWSVRGVHLEVVTWSRRVLHVDDPAARRRSPLVRGRAVTGAAPGADAGVMVALLASVTSAAIGAPRGLTIALRAARHLVAERADEMAPRLRALAEVLPMLHTFPELPDGTVATLTDHPDPWVRGFGLMMRAAVDENAGELPGSLVDARAAYAAFEQAGDHWGMGMAAQGIGQWSLANGDDEATVWLERGVGHMERVGAGPDARSTRVMLDLELALAGDDEAHARLVAVADAEQGDANLTAQAHVALAHVARGAGRQAEALARADAAVDLAEPDRVEVPQARAIFRLSAAAMHATAAGDATDPAVRAGNRARAYQLVRDARTDVEVSTDMPVLGSFALACAELAALDGDPATARELVALGRRLGAPLGLLLDRGLGPDLARALGDRAPLDDRIRELRGQTAAATATLVRTLTAPFVGDTPPPVPHLTSPTPRPAVPLDGTAG